MTARSLVSIIMPNHNGQQYLQAAIESALQQTYSPVEVIVIDDGSTDGSPAILAGYGETINWRQVANAGAPAARNFGLELARGEYVKFLDSDDLLLPDCLARQVEQAHQLPAGSKAIVYGDAIWVDEQGVQLPGFPHRPRRPGEDPITHVLQQSPLTSCPLHRRNYLAEIGGFDPQVVKGQELDLHLRLVAHGVEFVHFPGPVYHYRQHGSLARISNRSLAQGDSLSLLATIQRQVALLRTSQGQPLSSQASMALAQRSWAYGRATLREGDMEAANQYFVLAHELDARNCAIGSHPYLALVRLLGPVWAEKLIAGLQKLFATLVKGIDEDYLRHFPGGK